MRMVLVMLTTGSTNFQRTQAEDNDADDDHGNDDSDGEDEEALVKAWEGQQHPHASRPSVHPITHTEEKCERFSAILYVPHMYNIVKLILLSLPKFF